MGNGALELKFDADREKVTLYDQGVSSLKGAFDREWGPQLLEDYQEEFDGALRDGTTKGRGPNRLWFPAHPTRISAFIGLVMHPYVQEVSEAVVGPDYEVVELGFDTPWQGAKNQPWHRDFPIPRRARKEDGSIDIDYLVFNVTLKDVAEDMGPFEIAPGTQFLEEPDIELTRGMFVHKRYYPYFEKPGNTQRRMGRLGDLQVRTPLTLHRGTTHTSPVDRPVMVFGVTNPNVPTPMHSLPVTEEWLDGLTSEQQEYMQQHVRHTIAPAIGRITTPGTDVEELMMGKEDLIPY